MTTTMTIDNFRTPEVALDRCPKCQAELRDTGTRITTPTGQVRKVVECGCRRAIGDYAYSHYEGSLPL
jgi:hypothetical protein